MLIYLGETSPFYLLILDVINWFMFGHKLHIYYICGPGCEKTGLRGFRGIDKVMRGNKRSMGSQKQLIESEVKSFGGENIQAHSYSNYSVKSEPSASLTPSSLACN